MPMKSIYIGILSLCCIPFSFSQSINPPLSFYGEPVVFEKTECLTETDRTQLFQEIENNKKEILRKNPRAFDSRGSVAFIEPIRAKSGFGDYGYHTINYLVDHNLTPNNQLLDYYCENRTYDWASGNHQGTDYILWPYPWKRMQEGVMEIVAAAPGVIVQKKDGFYDLNCLNNGNPNWNGIVLEHANGSRTIYMHFKNGGITSKEVGDSVEAGEFLGLAGSSGSSTIPHLHFEVRDNTNQVIDPFQGSCNSMNNESWWVEQEPYYVSTINRLSTHYSGDFDDQCPHVENTYEELNFEPGDQLFLRMFFRDLKNNVPVEIQISNPQGTVISDFTWMSDFGQFYATAWAQWNWSIDENWVDGVYEVTVNFEGKTYETIFGINTELSMEEHQESPILLYPNPVQQQLYVQAQTAIQKISIYDISGKVVVQQTLNTTQTSLSVQHLRSGLYVVKIQSDNHISTHKLVKR